MTTVLALPFSLGIGEEEIDVSIESVKLNAARLLSHTASSYMRDIALNNRKSFPGYLKALHLVSMTVAKEAIRRAGSKSAMVVTRSSNVQSAIVNADSEVRNCVDIPE
jgi:hypothetical protein